MMEGRTTRSGAACSSTLTRSQTQHNADTQLPVVEGAGSFEIISDQSQQWSMPQPTETRAFVDEITPLTDGGYLVTMQSAAVEPTMPDIYPYVLRRRHHRDPRPQRRPHRCPTRSRRTHRPHRRLHDRHDRNNPHPQPDLNTPDSASSQRPESRVPNTDVHLERRGSVTPTPFAAELMGGTVRTRYMSPCSSFRHGGQVVTSLAVDHHHVSPTMPWREGGAWR